MWEDRIGIMYNRLQRFWARARPFWLFACGIDKSKERKCFAASHYALISWYIGFSSNWILWQSKQLCTNPASLQVQPYWAIVDTIHALEECFECLPTNFSLHIHNTDKRQTFPLRATLNIQVLPYIVLQINTGSVYVWPQVRMLTLRPGEPQLLWGGVTRGNTASGAPHLLVLAPSQRLWDWFFWC